MDFFTKFGDGAADILPLSGLNKRRVRALAAHLGAPSDLVDKMPTADLETLVPLRPDEDAYGLTYDQIDDFLEAPGKLGGLIARSLTENAKAQLAVESSANKGTKVTIVFKRSAAAS